MPCIRATMSRSVERNIRRERRLLRSGLVALFGACTFLLSSAFMYSATVAASTRTNVAKYGISFDLPKDWTQVSLTPGDIGGLLGDASKINARVKSALTSQATAIAQKGLKFFAVNPGASAEP